jgi:phosphoribosylformylglycinamidine cyclo-ligase
VLKGASHITGGGITENTPRMLPNGLAAEIVWGSWPVLPIFEFLRKIGNIPDDDYRRSFNLGIGMIFAVSKKDVKKAEQVLDKLGESFYPVGRVIAAPEGSPVRVVYR